jgi:hypothetical protein
MLSFGLQGALRRICHQALMPLAKRASKLEAPALPALC